MSIYLRELSKADIREINKWRNDKKTIDFLGSPFRYVSEDVDQNWYEQYLQTRHNTVRLAICDLDNDVIIGASYLLNIDWLNRNAEFAIWIGNESYREKGVGEASTRAVLEHAFKDLNLHRVYLTVLEDNVKAISLYRKVGFIKEGIVREAIFKNGCYNNLVSMSILNK